MSLAFLFFQLQGEFMCGGSPDKLTSLTAFFPCTVKHGGRSVIIWEIYHPILSVPLLFCIVGSIARITWTYSMVQALFLMVMPFHKTPMLRYIPIVLKLSWKAWRWARSHGVATTLSRSQYYWAFVVRIGATSYNRYPPPSCLKEIKQFLMEEWLQILLDEVRKLYDSIHRRIEAVQKAGGGPTRY